MRKESKWVCAVLFMAVLLLAAGNSSAVYAKSNASKTVYITAKELSLTKGQSAALSVKNNRKTVKWVSSNKKVASVNGKGKIKALKKGTAVVTAAVGKKKYKCSVTVSDKKDNVLIIYFSTTGTTKSAAKKIQKETNGTLIRLQPQKAYTKNYSKLLDVAMDEQESGKTILPFCTSGGSGISGSMSGIRKYAKGADVMQGKDLSGLSQADLHEWLKKAGVL